MAKKLLKQSVVWIAALAVMLTAIFVPLPRAAAEEAGTTVGAFTVTGGTNGTDYTYDGTDHVLTVSTVTALTIANTDPSTPTTDTIVVESASGANITLDGVNIDVSGTDNACAFEIADATTGDVTITLADYTENTLKSGKNCAGLQKNGENGKLEIKGAGSLTAAGGAYGAGIGGGRSAVGSDITISGSADVTATGGDYGAGIGGGRSAVGSDITISGSADVTATGGDYGAGIGGGGNDGSYGSSSIDISGSNITISDSAVVTATGGGLAAGIGGGGNPIGEFGGCGYGSNITISGSAVVTATGGEGGAGIGGGNNSSGTDITISGGSVKAIAGEYANAIGGGDGGAAVIPTNGNEKVYLLKIINADNETVTIGSTPYTPASHKAIGDEPVLYAYVTGENKTVTVGESARNYKFDKTTGTFTWENAPNGLTITATGGGELPEGACTYTSNVLTILTDTAVTVSGITLTDTIVVNSASGANITLDGLFIDVSETSDRCAFKIASTTKDKVTITLANGSANTLRSGAKCAGLQKESTADYKLEITTAENTTGRLIAAGGENGAGIGGGNNGSGSNITISGGTVTATGGVYGAGIGGGYEGNGENITISGSAVVSAAGGNHGAGIGGGERDDGSNIAISGGTVTATGGVYGAGIGGGERGDGSNIAISGGTVTATGGTHGAGIGGGEWGDGSNIAISGSADVTATGGYYGAGIGGGCQRSGSNITISGGTVTAKGGTHGAGIGGGNNGSGSNITISGGTVTAKGGTHGAGIGGGEWGDGSNIAISGSAVVTTQGGDGGAGIGGGLSGSASVIKITGGSVKAEGSSYTYISSTFTAPAIGYGCTNCVNGSDTIYFDGEPSTPTLDDSATNVYLLTINNADDKEVYIDGSLYNPKNHKSADPDDGHLYVYLTGTAHTVKLGADGEGVEYKLCGTGADAKFKIVPKAEDFTFSAPASLTYNGSAVEATVTTAVNGMGKITVKYYDESDTELNSAPVVPGDYTVKIDVAEGDTYANAEDITADNWKFTIIKATPDSPDETSFTLDLTVDSNNTYTATINTYLSGVEYSFDGTTWSDTNSKTGIAHNTTVTAYVRFKETNEYYASSSSSGSVTTAHGNVTSEWSKDAQGHWHACATCPNDKLDFAQHTSSGAATVGTAETCTICGYEINPAVGVTAAPVITPNGGTFTGSQTVTITCATDGATIYYTTDGATPTTASTKYAGAFSITDTKTIKAIAVKDGMGDSKVITAEFTKQSSGGGSGGGHSSNYPISTNPTINGVSKSWSDIANELSKLAADSEVTIELNGNYEVPAEVIKAITDKNLKVTFVIDSWRSWYLDGADIEKPAAADFSAIQLPSSVIDGSSLRGTAGARLRIDGTNNPTALTISFNKKYAGEFANLYRKDGDKLVFVDTVKIDENGSAQLEITDGGDYIFMLCEYSDRPGDMNNDGKLTAADASAMLKYIVRLIDDGNVQMADLNGDGKINARDAVIALKKVVGLI